MAEKKSKSKKPASVASFNLLDDDSFASRTKEALMKVRKKGTTVDSLTNVRREILNLPPIYLQATLNSFGIQTKTLVDIIGA